MRTILNVITVVGLSGLITGCGTAAEKKENMLNQAKRMDDSLLNHIDSSLNAPLNALSMAKPALVTTTYVFEYK